MIGGATLYLGDALEVVRALPDCSVHCCVTSPPYWGLRDYGTAKWEGGDPACDHKQESPRERDFANRRGETKANGFAGTSCTSWSTRDVTVKARRNCRKCGALRIDSQLGLEPTPQEYVEKMVAVFREVHRVLRDDGTIFLNLGDSYASGGRATYRSGVSENKGQDVQNDMPRPNTPSGLKPKDLCGTPWRVAFALQADGWYLRQDIIWSKPNPMPESVRDRCTKSHEYLFLLVKSERYYFDAEAITEESIYKAGEGGHQRFGAPGGKAEIEYGAQVSGEIWNSKGTRNKRSVWTIATAPFKGAHFATFPPKLIEPCILAGCPPGGFVLDPFAGSGTAGEVALGLSRGFIGIELSEIYFNDLFVPRIENAQRQMRMFA